jgi:hypothetical protein
MLKKETKGKLASKGTVDIIFPIHIILLRTEFLIIYLLRKILVKNAEELDMTQYVHNILIDCQERKDEAICFRNTFRSPLLVNQCFIH